MPSISPERDDFVGRETELSALKAAWSGGDRLLTLLGPGGSGKTRLARHFALGVRDSDELETRVWFCDLAQARTGLEVIEVVARKLDLPLARSGEVETLALGVAHALAEAGRCVLVLDNLEQVVDDARAVIEQWLDLAPEAMLLVTSRERLRVAGERCITLGSLPLPSVGASAEAILSADSVKLFVSRASAARSEFAAQVADCAPELAALVRKLEGLPLAIELCAARIVSLSPAQLLERLDQRFETLVDRRGRSGRQATLEATIDWSWQLLGAVEHQALSQCTVFRGDFDLEGAEAVVVTEPPQPGLDLLESLIDRSLVSVRESSAGPRRYFLLESVREFCEGRLEGSKRREAEERHAVFYLARYRDVPRGSLASQADEPNLIAVHERALRNEDSGRALDAALALEPVLSTRGPVQRLIELLDTAMQGAPSSASLSRAMLSRGLAKSSAGDIAGAAVDFVSAAEADDKALAMHACARLGVARTWLGKLDDAEVALERGNKLRAEEGDPFAAGQVEMAFGILRSFQGRMTDALEHYAAALELLRASGAKRDEGMALENLGNRHLERGDLPEAADYLNAALELFRELGDLRLEAHTLGDVAVLQAELGNFEESGRVLERAVSLAQRVGDRHWQGVLRGFLGDLALEQDDPAAACEHYRFATDQLSRVGNRRFAAVFKAALAAAEALAGRAARAAELCQAARGELEAAGTPDDLRAADLWAIIVGLARDATADAANATRAELHSVARLRRDEIFQAYAAPDARPPNEVRLADRVVRQRLSGSERASGLRIAEDASWFEAGGERVNLSRRTSLRLILAELCRARETDPTEVRDVNQLFEAGWPGQRVKAGSAAHRVHVAIASLRKLGLDSVLETRGDGYALGVDPTRAPP